MSNLINTVNISIEYFDCLRNLEGKKSFKDFANQYIKNKQALWQEIHGQLIRMYYNSDSISEFRKEITEKELREIEIEINAIKEISKSFSDWLEIKK